MIYLIPSDVVPQVIDGMTSIHSRSSSGEMMQLGFVFFHAAYNHFRHLLIKVDCFLQYAEDRKNSLNCENENLPEKLVEELVHLSKSMTVDMENFAWRLSQNQDCLKTFQHFIEIENTCHQLLDENLLTINCILDVANRFGFAERVRQELKDIAVRTKLVQSQLREYAGIFLLSYIMLEKDNRKLCSGGSADPKFVGMNRPWFESTPGGWSNFKVSNRVQA